MDSAPTTPTAPTAPTTTQPTDRDIFAYHDGEKVRRGDPLVLHRKLLAGLKDVDAQQVLKDVASEHDAVSLPALDQLLPAVRSAFGLKELDDDGRGLTTTETLAVLSAFLDYLSKKKPSSETSPDSSPPITSGPPCPDDPSTTTPTSDSV